MARIEIKNQANGSIDIFLTGEIGDSWWDEHTTSANDIVDRLPELRAANAVNLYINSPGGDAFDGIAIYNVLKEFAAKTTAHVIGLAASAASVVLMAADNRIIHTGGMVMVHRAWSYVAGNCSDLRKTAQDLEALDSSLANIYAENTGLEEAVVQDLMLAETWMTAAEAVEKGFCTQEDTQEVAALVSIPKSLASVFKHIPENVKNLYQPTKRDAEKALRDAGFSASVSRGILAHGFKNQRDAGPDFSAAIKLARSILNKE